MGDLTTLAKLKTYLAMPASWAQSTLYAQKDQARANGNLYECITAGTSSGSGTGPSGTTSDITDGTAHWKYLNENRGIDDTTLSRLISAVSAFFANYCDRTFEATNWTYTVSGPGGTQLMLPEYPVTAVSSVILDGTTISARASVGAYGYILTKPNTLNFDGGGYWKRGIANVTVAFSAGYATIPSDLEGAVIETCASWYRRRARIDEQSKSVQGEVISFSMADVPNAAMSVLDVYRRPWATPGDLVVTP